MPYRAEWTEGICHKWFRGRHFSPSLPGDRYLELGSKSDLPAEILGSIVGYDALATRPEVLLLWKSTDLGLYLMRRRKFHRSDSQLWHHVMSSCAFFNCVVPLPAHTSGCTVWGKYLELKQFLMSSCRSYYITI